MTDKKILNIVSASTLAALLIIFFIPFDTVGRVLAAVAMSAAAVIALIFIKKRSILSINHKQVLIIMSLMAVILLMLYYLSGLKFGFFKNPYALKSELFFSHFLPIAAVIAASEIFRHIVRSQNNKSADVMCYFACVFAEMLICSTAKVAVSSFSNFMELVAMTMLPAAVSNLLYHYLSKRYGIYPNMVYRLIMTLYVYIIPIASGISDSLVAFFNLLLPIAIYAFIDALYEKKRHYALKRKNRFEIPITILAVAALLSVVMLVSNQFRYGSLVIATESMTGELDKGDVAIFDSRDENAVNEGQVIVFERNGSMIVHRVVDIQTINGQNRYFTKGDANDDIDVGYVVDSDIVGLVDLKIPYIGYPTLWLRSLFAR